MPSKTRRSARSSASAKKEEPAFWQATDHNKYDELAKSIVTHSFKAVNSNIEPGGVRVSCRPDSDFPYICTASLSDTIRLDQSANAGISKLIAQILAVREGKLAFYRDTVVQEDVDHIQNEVLPRLASPQDGGSAPLNPRLRQIFLETGRGGDLLMTPLYASSLADLVSRRMGAVRTERGRKILGEQRSPAQDANPRLDAGEAAEPRWLAARGPFDTASLLVGGGQPQNAGRREIVVAMNKPVIAPAPGVPVGRQARHARGAFRYYHRGVSLRPRKSSISRYIWWLKRQPRDASGRILRNRIRVQDEVRLVRGIADDLLFAGKAAAEKLAPLLEDGTIGDLTASKLPSTIRGMVDETLRNRAWCEETGAAVAKLMTEGGAGKYLQPADRPILATILAERFMEETPR